MKIISRTRKSNEIKSFGINKRVKNLTLPADGRFRFVNETIE